ncbi:MAG: ribosome maturation factor RimM [Bacteroidota bacterium]
MWVPGGAKAGKISKPYGLQGQVILILSPEAGKHIKPDNPLFILMDGQRVPFFVQEFDQLSKDQAVVKFEFIESLEEARKLTSCEVYFDPAQKPLLQDSSGQLDAIVGYKAYDRDLGFLGSVTDYIDHDMNPVLIIDFKGKELMVPAVNPFIHKIDPKEQSIHFILPEGLTTL